MTLVLFFLVTSVLLNSAALPMHPTQGSSSVPNPDHVPKVEFGAWRMWKHDKEAATDIIINHYKGLEPGNEQKKAKLAFAKATWYDGKTPDDEHMQHINVNYHRGDTQKSAKIGQTVTLSRVRPPPETYYGNAVPRDHRLDLEKVTAKEYKALPPDQAQRVRSMRVKNGWSEGPGLREETQFTYHNAIIPRPGNAIGEPVTIYRPMSFLIDKNVPEKEAPVIKRRIRQGYEDLDENHPLKKANYGVVTQGWHRSKGGTIQVAEATLYKVKDKLTDGPEEDFERVGNFDIPLGNGRRPEVSSHIASSATQEALSPRQ